MFSMKTNWQDTTFNKETLNKAIDDLNLINQRYSVPHLCIQENDQMVDYIDQQIKFSRRNKKRIQKKFKKLYTKTIISPKQEYYWFKEKGIIVCHPTVANQIRKMFGDK